MKITITFKDDDYNYNLAVLMEALTLETEKILGADTDAIYIAAERTLSSEVKKTFKTAINEIYGKKQD